MGLGLLAGGCGAKTGLDVPDTGFDAGPDGGFDAGLDADIPCFEVPLDGDVIQVPLELEAQLARADVLFLVDTTLSMDEEIGQIQSTLRDEIVPGIDSAIPDSTLGVASFGDFPEGNCGDRGDSPFRLVLPQTDEVNRVQAAVDSLELGNGLDRPESQTEALYQVATGEGIGSYVPPSFGCPGGGAGYPCFRDDALPIVLMFTDAPFHNGPGGSNSYATTSCGISPPPHTYAQALAELNAQSIRVIGLYSGTGMGLGDLNAVATDTNALTETGAPLVFNIGQGGGGLSSSVVQAIETLADVIEFDVDTVLEDPEPADGIDPRDFVEAVIPVRADPMDRIERIDVDSGTFIGVRAGTTVFFELQIRAGSVVPGPEPRRVRLEIIFRGDRRTRLGSRVIELVIPAEDGRGCEGI